MNNIHESLLSLAIEIKLLLPLDRNPRKGNIQAIMASYAEFGQIKPIVVRPNGDGFFTVVAGNHQLQAATNLGWDKIAAVRYDVDDERAIAFAIADNRTVELGYTEPELLNELIIEINDYYPELMENLGWDEFEIAQMEQTDIQDRNQIIDSSSYAPPVLINTQDSEETGTRETNPFKSPLVSVRQEEDGNDTISLNSSDNQNDVAIRGSTMALRNSAPNAVVTVQITFETTEQQSRWYEFIKTLKINPDYPGTTVSEKILSFIESHS